MKKDPKRVRSLIELLFHKSGIWQTNRMRTLIRTPLSFNFLSDCYGTLKQWAGWRRWRRVRRGPRPCPWWTSAGSTWGTPPAECTASCPCAKKTGFSQFRFTTYRTQITVGRSKHPDKYLPYSVIFVISQLRVERVFQIRDVLIRIQILGSVPPNYIPEPDPALFFSDFQDTNKK